MRLFEYVDQGGFIMYILVLLNIVGITLLLWRMVTILGFKKQLEQHIQNVKARFENHKQDHQVVVSLVKDEVAAQVHDLEFGLNTIKIIASISPLLGLLGTVVGIFTAFEVISQKGLNDPSLFAGGISLALITTVGGLIVAIPHFIGYNYLTGLLDDIELKFEKSVIAKLYAGEK
jgi:biopolymer transport protein ExbB